MTGQVGSGKGRAQQLLLWMLLAAACAEPPPVTDIDPCAEEDPPGRVTRLCLWAAPADLSRILAAPEERMEIDAEVSRSGERFDRVELELHGGSARGQPKKSFRITFDDPVDLDVYGTGAEPTRRLVLQAAYFDRSFMRARLAMDLVREEGGLAPRVGYVVLFVNGQEQGLYQAIERIDEYFFARQGLSTDANVYKAESHLANWGVHENPLGGFQEDTHEDGVAEDLGELFRVLNAAPLSEQAYRAEVEPRVSIADWERWNRVMVYAHNLDTFTKNYYLHHALGEASAPFRIVMWDADASFGNYWDGVPADPAGSDAHYWHSTYNAFAQRYFRVEPYRSAYLDAFEADLDGRMSAAQMRARLQPIAELIRDEAIRDLARWNPSYDFDAEVERVQSFLDRRPDVLRDAIEDGR